MTTPVEVPQDLGAAALAVHDCRRCPLWENATRAVWGEGPPDAAVALVGEQPGDREDIAGRPFVGPAGRLLDQALVAAGLDRSAIYVTNAVKHFKWQARGKRRIHAKPSTSEIEACAPWLAVELAEVAPSVLVLAGATAVRSVLGPGRTIGGLRGRVIEEGPVRATVVTAHPSSVVRLQGADREAAFEALTQDLALAAAAIP